MKEIYPWYLRAWVGPVALVAFIGFVMVMIVVFGSMEAARVRADEAVLESRAVRPGIHACSIQRSTDAIIKLSKIMRMEFDEIRKRLDGMEKAVGLTKGESI